MFSKKRWRLVEQPDRDSHDRKDGMQPDDKCVYDLLNHPAETNPLHPPVYAQVEVQAQRRAVAPGGVPCLDEEG